MGTLSPSPIPRNAGPWSRAGKVGWPGKIMQGGPQLPGQLTAINKENVVRPAPEAAGAANSGPARGGLGDRWRGGPGQADPRATKGGTVAPGAQPPPSVPGFLPSCILRWEGVFYVLHNPPQKCSQSVWQPKAQFHPNDGETHQRHFWGSLSKAFSVHPTWHDPCSGAAPGTPSTAPPGWWPGRRTPPLQAECTTTRTRLPKVHSG